MTNQELVAKIKEQATIIEKLAISPTISARMVLIKTLATSIRDAGHAIIERRVGERRKLTDTPGSPRMRVGARRRGTTGSMQVPPPQPIVTTLNVLSSAPSNFEPTDTHQIVVELRNNVGDLVTGRTVTYLSSDTNLATVSAGGLVTAVAVGQPTISIKAEGLSALAFYNITVPVDTVVSVDVTPTTMSLAVGEIGVLSAVPRNASGQAVLNQTVAWQEGAGTGDVTLSADTGPESHQTTVQGALAGSRIVTATSNSIVSNNAAITITTPSGVTDSLGILHELLPVGFLPFVNRLYGSTKGSQLGANTGVGNGATRVGDYYKGYCEGNDDAAESSVTCLADDPTVPFQAARAVLYPSNGNRFGYYTLDNGDAGNNSFAKSSTFENINSGRYNNPTGHNPCFNLKPRRIYWRQVFKYRDNFPQTNITKFGAFVNTRGSNNMMMLQCGAAWAGQARINMQGTPDNDLSNAANLGGLTNGIWSPNGVCLLSDSDDGNGIGENWAKGLWWDKVFIARTNTYNGPYNCGPVDPKRNRCPGQTGDGWMELWTRSSADGLNWTAYRRVAFWDRMLNSFAVATATTWWASVAQNFMLHTTYSGAQTGMQLAMDSIWLGEFE